MPDDPGTLYVLANRDLSLAKLGFTRNGTPDARATDYERRHGIVWRVYWSARANNVAEAEAKAHWDLADQRFELAPNAREIFHCTPRKAVAVAQRYIVPVAGAEIEAPTLQPLRHLRLERVAAAVLLIIATIPAARRLYRRVRITARELHALLRHR